MKIIIPLNPEKDTTRATERKTEIEEFSSNLEKKNISGKRRKLGDSNVYIYMYICICVCVYLHIHTHIIFKIRNVTSWVCPMQGITFQLQKDPLMGQKSSHKTVDGPHPAYSQVVTRGPPENCAAKVIPELGERKTGIPLRSLPSELRVTQWGECVSCHQTVWVQILAQSLEQGCGMLWLVVQSCPTL